MATGSSSAGVGKQTVATAHQGETLDALAWRVTAGSPPPLEALLDLNPGLAARGLILTEGETIILPNVAPTPTPLVQLWTL